MGYRNFRDAHGVSWQAWDVIPRLAERRRADRRRMQRPIPFDDRRRMGSERRLTNRQRGVLMGGLEHGWLAFESEQDDRRRLSPIPADWMRCSDEELADYCESAPAVRRSKGLPIDF